jgi:hypothetical protein
MHPDDSSLAYFGKLGLFICQLKLIAKFHPGHGEDEVDIGVVDAP